MRLYVGQRVTGLISSLRADRVAGVVTVVAANGIDVRWDGWVLDQSYRPNSWRAKSLRPE